MEVTCQETDRLKKIEVKLDKIVDNQMDIKINIQDIKKDVKVNTKDLTEHKEGVIQNRKRIETLEKPAIILSGIKNIAVYVVTIIGLIIALKKLNII